MTALVVVMAIVAALLLLYIGGAVSQPEFIDLAVQPEPIDYWYPASLVDLAEARHTDKVMARAYAAMFAPAPVVPIGQPIPAALGRAA